MNEQINGMSSHEMILEMYQILVTGKDGQPPLQEQVRNNATNIKYLKSNRIYKIILGLLAAGQGLAAYKIFFGG